MGYLYRYNSEHHLFSAISSLARRGHIDALRKLLVEEESFPSRIRQPWREPPGSASHQSILRRNGFLRHVDNPLHEAAGRGHEHIVVLLLEAGADPNSAPDCDESALLATVEKIYSLNIYHNHYRIVRLLLDDTRPGIPFNKDDLYESLMTAAYRGLHEIVGCLLDNMVAGSRQLSENDYDAINYRVYKATKYGYTESVKFLVPMMYNVNPLLHIGRRALSVAAEYRHNDIFYFLLENGADPKLLEKRWKKAVPIRHSQS